MKLINNEKKFFKLGRKIGIADDILKLAWEDKARNCLISQIIADYDAAQRGSCQTPRPAPKLEPGYWECVGGSWEWVPAV